MTNTHLQHLEAAIQVRNTAVGKPEPFEVAIYQDLRLKSFRLDGEALVVSNKHDGFWGVFRTYTADAMDDLAADLRLLADHCEHLRLTGKRPPSVVLFAVLIGNKTPEAFATRIRSLQNHERLLQTVSLSRLCWKDETVDHLTAWSHAADLIDMEIERFLAPLLMTVRQARARGTVHAHQTAWRQQLEEKVNDLLQVKGSPADSPLGKVEHAVRKQLALEVQKSIRLQSEDAAVEPAAPSAELQSLLPLSVERLEVEGYRRYGQRATINLGRLTVLYGPNGTGKSSLIEAIPLAFTGKVRRQDTPVTAEALRHNGARSNRVDSLGTLHVRGGQPGAIKEQQLQIPAAKTLLPTESFYLSQDALREFLTESNDKRFAKIARIFGLDDTRLKSVLETLEENLKNACRADWEEVVAKVSKRTDFSLTRFEAALRKHLALDWKPLADLVKQVTGLVKPRLFGQGNEIRPLTSLLSLVDALGKAVQTAMRAQESLQHDLFRGESPRLALQDLAHARNQIVHLLEELNSFPASVILTYGVAVERSQLVQAAEETSAHITQADKRRLQEIEAAIERLHRLLFWLSQFDELASNAIEVEEGLRTDWDKIYPESPLLTQLHNLQLQDLLNVTKALSTSRSGVRVLRTALTAQIEALENEAEPLRQYAEPRVKDVHATHSLQVAEQALTDALGMMPNAVQFETLVELAKAVETLRRAPVPELMPSLAPIVSSYHEPPTGDLASSGLFARLYALQLLGEVKTKLTEAVGQQMLHLIQSNYGRPVREILWTLTGTNWSHYQVELKLEEGEVSLQTELGGVTEVYNAAEQNLLGLSLFFVGYLYVGSSLSKAIFLDDPFQSLDDINLLSCVRFIDDVAKAVGAEQVVMALHQEALARFIQREFGMLKSEGGEKSRDPVQGNMVFVEVTATGDHASQVACQPRPFAAPEPLLEIN